MTPVHQRTNLLVISRMPQFGHPSTKTPTNNMKSIEAANASAVLLIKQDRPREAIRSFKTAVSLIEQRVDATGSICEGGGTSGFLLNTLVLPVNEKVKHSSVSHLEFFNRAFLLDGTWTKSSSASQNALHVASSTILYNMGVVFHSMVMDGSYNFVVNASNLYKLAIKTLGPVELDGSSPGVMLLAMALFNNLAHLNSLLHQSKETCFYIHHLRVILNALREDIGYDEVTRLDEIDFFVSSIVLYDVHGYFTLAPAA